MRKEGWGARVQRKHPGRVMTARINSPEPQPQASRRNWLMAFHQCGQQQGRITCRAFQPVLRLGAGVMIGSLPAQLTSHQRQVVQWLDRMVMVMIVIGVSRMEMMVGSFAKCSQQHQHLKGMEARPHGS